MKRLFLYTLAVSALVFIFSVLVHTDFTLYLSSGAIHLGILSAALFFLWKKDIRTTFASIGFPGSLKKNIIYSVGGLLLVFITLFILAVVTTYLGLNDQEKILEKVGDLPFYILVFAVVFAPLTEELFFRAFLVQRIGVLYSSLVFGIFHLSYGSVSEIIGAFFIGLIFAVIFKKSKSITPCLVIHTVYNLLAIIAMRLYL